MMRIKSATLRITTFVAACLMLFPAVYADETAGVSVPDAFSLEELTAMELTPLDDIPVEYLLEKGGSTKHFGKQLFKGQTVWTIYQAGPAKFPMEPIVYDEFIIVLKGTLVLTDAAGNSKTYRKGDSVMLPEGFSGTWHMTEEFRELVIVETNAYNLSQGIEE